MISKITNLSDKSVDHSRSKLVFDSQFETFFDSITNLTARICQAPISLITFVNDENIWVHSQVGCQLGEVLQNKKKFCGIFPEENNLIEIGNTDLDEIHQNHQFFIDGKKAKFYAGSKIKLPLGETIGVLCIFDVIPRKLNSVQRTYLIGMAEIIEKALVTRSFVNHLS